MSKKGYISRYLIIIKKLKAKPFSNFEELKSNLEYQLDFLKDNEEELKVGFSKRTLQRDLREIRNLFGIEIEFSKSKGGYYISNSESENLNFQRMIEAFDLFNLLNRTQDTTPFIYFENRKPKGTENFNGLLHAIENKKQIRFTYQRYDEDEITHRLVEPFALKEFKNRWYLMANDLKDSILKSFALDRLTELNITTNTFEWPVHYNVDEMFRYSFGIMSPNETEPQEVILSFTPLQGKYIKSLPLHQTQQILIESEKEFQISLKIFITYDFIMELLSYGETVKILKPDSLVEKIKELHLKAAGK